MVGQIIAGIVLFVIMLLVGIRMSRPTDDVTGGSCGSDCACCNGSCTGVELADDIDANKFDDE